MVKIKMDAMYDHFPDRHPAAGEPCLNFYADSHIPHCTAGSRINVAMLLEPRSMLDPAYDYVLKHPDYFGAIFTHDSEILTHFDHAHELIWADVWLTTDSEKTKDISLCTSPKNWCPLHDARLRLYKFYKDRDEVDCFYGNWNDTQLPAIDAKDYLEHYKYSIIIENDIDELWFTEKILNCFATKTVPIYVGSPMIGELFNPEGIITVNEWKDVPDIVGTLYETGLERDYASRQQAIEDNFKRVEPYKTPWKERFFRDYEPLLEELLNG